MPLVDPLPEDHDPALVIVLAIVLGVALAACSLTGTQVVENPNIYPANYRDEVLKTLTEILIDQAHVRDAYISDPVLTPVDKDQRYTICVRYNGRNDRLEYMGSTDRIGYFYEGHLSQLVEATKAQCGSAAYKPFPELEKLCQAKTCQ